MTVDLMTDKELEIPKSFLHDKRITSGYTKVVYIVLKDFALDGINNPSMAEIAELARCNAVTVRKAIKTLIETGWVKRALIPLENPVYEVYDEPQEEMPEIEVSHATLANRKSNDLTAPRRKQFGRVVK